MHFHTDHYGGGVYPGTLWNEQIVAFNAVAPMLLTLIDNRGVAAHAEEVHR